MKRAANNGKKLTTTAPSDLEQYEAALLAKQQFLTTALNMGWQLAVAVLAPLLLGIWLDKRYNSSPSYTIVAFMVAVTAGAVIVWRTVQGVNSEMQTPTKKRGKKN